MNLEQHIIREIENNGPISFARFMESALYLPDLGYYEHSGRVGRSGDFYTSVSVGSVFGELMAEQIALWVQAMGQGPFTIVECGANDGQLAMDILQAFRSFQPELGNQIRYLIIESSGRRRQWQETFLQEFQGQVEWVQNLDQLSPVRGLFLSNELLDAFPFHRLCWSKKDQAWLEWKVALADGSFQWQIGPLSPEIIKLVPIVPTELAEVMPDGFTTEVSPVAETWWRSAARKLERGKLLTVDYGLTSEEFLFPERRQGTARGYLKHQLVDDLLANPGAQDITAHVNFSALVQAGEAEGLKTEFFGAQSTFLTKLLTSIQGKAGQWERKKLAQLQTLVHPAHLGAKFKVLVQAK